MKVLRGYCRSTAKCLWIESGPSDIGALTLHSRCVLSSYLTHLDGGASTLKVDPSLAAQLKLTLPGSLDAAVHVNALSKKNVVL